MPKPAYDLEILKVRKTSDSLHPETMSNIKLYFQIYSHYATADSLRSSDSTELFTLACQRPARDGPAIYKAGTLYEMAFDAMLVFNDDSCKLQGYSMRKARNLADSKMHTLKLESHEANQIKGKNGTKLGIYRSRLKILLNINIAKGLYFVHMTNEKGLHPIKKLIIN